MFEDICKRVFRWLEIFFVVLASVLIVVALVFLIRSPGNPADTKVGQIIKLLNDNWKVLLIFLIPLFYRPIQTFLERVDEAFGMKTQKPLPPSPSAPTPKKKEQ